MEKNTNNDYKQLGSISEVFKVISSAFVLKFKKEPPIPPSVLYIGCQNRGGLSAQQIAARIIARQQEAGAPLGVLIDGGDNISERMERIRVEEIVNALLTESKIEIAIPPGIPVAVAPLGGAGATSSFAKGLGVIR